MRAVAILILLVAFVAAVVMPNDIGTPNLPATGSKFLKAAQSHPLKAKAVAWFTLAEIQGSAIPTTGTRWIVFRGAQPVAKVRFSAPLLI